MSLTILPTIEQPPALPDNDQPGPDYQNAQDSSTYADLPPRSRRLPQIELLPAMHVFVASACEVGMYCGSPIVGLLDHGTSQGASEPVGTQSASQGLHEHQSHAPSEAASIATSEKIKTDEQLDTI
jgi:hypothetical protein